MLHRVSCRFRNSFLLMIHRAQAAEKLRSKALEIASCFMARRQGRHASKSGRQNDCRTFVRAAVMY